jgi:hypothetical protein
VGDLLARARYAIEHGNGDELHRELLAEVERLRAESMSQEDPRPGICACGQRLNMHDMRYCTPDPDDLSDEDVHQCRSCDQRSDTHSIGCPMHPDYDPDLT